MKFVAFLKFSIFSLLILQVFQRKTKFRSHKASHEEELKFLRKEIDDPTFNKNLDDPTKQEKLFKYLNENKIHLIDTSKDQKQFSKVMDYYDSDYSDYFANKYSDIMKIDEKSNINLLDELVNEKVISTDSILDVAAGDGRLSKKVFHKYFKKIDSLEPVESLANRIIDLKKTIPQIDKVFIQKVEDFTFTRKYDVIWTGWFLSHLKDVDVLKYLIKSRDYLSDGGKIICKENVSESKEVSYLENQKVRPLKIFEFFFDLVGLKVIINRKTPNYPQGYVPLQEIVLSK